MASTKEGFYLGDQQQDEVVNNLLFTISHTGKHANSALNTPVRVVCANTMRFALSGADEIITHNHRAVFDPEALKVALGVSSKNFGELEEFAKACATRAMSGEEEIEPEEKPAGSRITSGGLSPPMECVGEQRESDERNQQFDGDGAHAEDVPRGFEESPSSHDGAVVAQQLVNRLPCSERSEECK